MSLELTTLLSVVRQQKTLQHFWLNFFTTQINFETKNIQFDRVSSDYRILAPFVVPNAQGRPMTMEGYDSIQFTPAYVKPKYVVDPEMVLERQPGEALGAGSLTNQQRYNAVIAELLKRGKHSIENRWEWLAARAVIDGGVTIASEDYPSTFVDFRRDPSLTSVLTLGARWSEATSDPMADLKMMRRKVNDLTGSVVRTHIFGADAYDAFATREKEFIKDMLDTNIRGSGAEIKRLTDDLDNGMEYIGVLKNSDGSGRLEVWVCTTKFTNEEGVEEYLLDQGTVVGVASALSGVRCFGAIRDKRAGFRALPIFPKNWEEEDPSVEYLLMQSAPLMVPKVPNASYSMKVVD